MSPRSTRRRPGFTLVELGVVILIIGLLMSFLLVASWEGLRRGEERATQALILKLDAAMSDRIEALSQQRPPANLAHRYLSMTRIPGGTDRYIPSEDRARLIARIDYIKRELPDVFFVQADDFYPLNFAGMAFYPETAAPIGSVSSVGTLPAAYSRYILPLGHGLSSPGGFSTDGVYSPTPGTLNWRYNGSLGAQAGEGIFGASYSAMAALTRQLGYPKRGYNGVDDDGNGLVDERSAAEFGLSADGFNTLNTTLIEPRLNAHRHITARSEMLYAILVNGTGPLGSVFSADDFTQREVRDTDGDNLPEFVDAWGRPLQFYRWPVYFTTDYGPSTQSFQMGSRPYAGRIQTRDQNPLDPNQLLVSPSWWVDLSNLVDSPAQLSARANLFQQHFFSLIDPNASVTASSAQGQLWDRNGFYKRRAYFTKFLIASSGPDRQLGLGSYGVSYGDTDQADVNNYLVNRDTRVARIPTGTPADLREPFALRMILIENQASRSDPHARPPGTAGTLSIDATGAGERALYQAPSSGNDLEDATARIQQWSTDDITNQTINSPGTGVR